GKCFPCQLGTQRQYEIIQRIAEGKPLPGDVERLSDVGWTMTDASLCGLGQTAASAVLSALKLWPQLFTLGKE
ncbi:MAG: NADH-ubiquinone oxidoreductase-F iron-sulfur binding region domain-containing protein, partial [Candidatus Kryptoniota bacterium]